MSMMKFFMEIWEHREHFSEISGLPLPEPGTAQFHWCFSHILAKGAFGRYARLPENIVLMLPQEHVNWENMTEADKQKPWYLAHRENWDKLLLKEEELRQRYFRER